MRLFGATLKDAIECELGVQRYIGSKGKCGWDDAIDY